MLSKVLQKLTNYPSLLISEILLNKGVMELLIEQGDLKDLENKAKELKFRKDKNHHESSKSEEKGDPENINNLSCEDNPNLSEMGLMQSAPVVRKTKE